MEALENCFDIKDAWLNWLNVEPVFDRLKGEPRFIELKEKVDARINFSDSFVNFSADESREILKNDQVDAEKLTTSVQESSFHDRETMIMTAAEKITNLKQGGGATNSRKFIYFGVAAAVLLTIFGLYWTNILTFSATFGPKTTQTAAAKSLTMVVLPLKTVPGEEDYGIGVAESLTSKLGNIKRLTVISATSGRALADRNVIEIGQELGAGYVLRGNIESLDDQHNIVAEFVNTADGQPIWKETFAGEGNLINAQTKIAEKIWTTLQIDPSPFEIQQVRKTFTHDHASYELYLLGRFQMTNRSPENLKKAINTLSQASAADPDFVLAYAGLADAYLLLNLYQIPPPLDAYRMSQENARHALKLDENLAEAHASLAYVKFYSERDRSGAELEFHRAIQLNPSYATAHHWFALALAAMNKPAESISEAKIAQTLDPVAPSIKAATAIVYFYDKQYEEGLSEAEKALKIDPGFVPAHKVKRWIYQAKGDYSAAMSSFMCERSLSGGDDSPGWFVTQAQIEALGNDRENALKRLKLAVADESVKNNPSAYSFELALAFAALGEKQKALDWLEKAEASDTHSFNSIEVDPRLATLLAEPRFASLVSKLKTSKSIH